MPPTGCTSFAVVSFRRNFAVLVFGGAPSPSDQFRALCRSPPIRACRRLLVWVAWLPAACIVNALTRCIALHGAKTSLP
jgi:hypothetical protein